MTTIGIILGFGTVVPPEQIGGDAEKPGPGVIPVKVVGFALFPDNQKGFRRDVVGGEIASPSGGVSVDGGGVSVVQLPENCGAVLAAMKNCPQAASSVHGGGHEVCPVTAIKDAHRRPAETHSVRARTPEITRRRHHRPTTSSEYSRRGEREGPRVCLPIGVAGSHPWSARHAGL
jgi:hypothetical protein